MKDALGSFGREWLDYNGTCINNRFSVSVIETELVKFVNNKKAVEVLQEITGRLERRSRA